MELRCWLRDQLASHLYYALSVCSILIQRLMSRLEADTVKCPPITRLSLLAARSLPCAGKFSLLECLPGSGTRAGVKPMQAKDNERS